MTSTEMSMSAAIRKARSYVSIARSSRTSYHIYGPYSVDNLSGPSSEITRSDWWQARSARTHWVAQIALGLMGRYTHDAAIAVHMTDHGPPADVRTLVKAGLAASVSPDR